MPEAQPEVTEPAADVAAPGAEEMAAAQAEREAREEEARKAAEAAFEAGVKRMQMGPFRATLMPTPTRIPVVPGATLLAELTAAGLGPGISVTPDAVEVDPATDAATLARIRAVVAAHDPSAPPPPAPLPDLSDRQFGEGLWRDGLISFEEYIGFAGPGVVPGPLLAIIDNLPDDDTGRPTPRKLALGLVTGAQSYQFGNPLVDSVRQAKGWTVDHLRERWAAWATL